MALQGLIVFFHFFQCFFQFYFSFPLLFHIIFYYYYTCFNYPSCFIQYLNMSNINM